MYVSSLLWILAANLGVVITFQPEDESFSTTLWNVIAIPILEGGSNFSIIISLAFLFIILPTD